MGVLVVVMLRSRLLCPYLGHGALIADTTAKHAREEHPPCQYVIHRFRVACC